MKTRGSFVGVFFVIAVSLVLSACVGLGSDRPLILSGYQSYTFDGKLRFSEAQHPGIDFGELYGAPVLAAADGKVINLNNSTVGCGIGVLLLHFDFRRYTVYCHLEKYIVAEGQQVKRGEVIGFVGISGRTYGVPHLHWELCTYQCDRGHNDGSLWGTEDPLAVTAGCFDPKRTYPAADRLVLTYPVQCKD